MTACVCDALGAMGVYSIRIYFPAKNFAATSPDQDHWFWFTRSPYCPTRSSYFFKQFLPLSFPPPLPLVFPSIVLPVRHSTCVPTLGLSLHRGVFFAGFMWLLRSCILRCENGALLFVRNVLIQFHSEASCDAAVTFKFPFVLELIFNSTMFKRSM